MESSRIRACHQAIEPLLLDEERAPAIEGDLYAVGAQPAPCECGPLREELLDLRIIVFGRPVEPAQMGALLQFA